MKCKYCGTENLEGQEICSYCGEELKKGKGLIIALIVTLIVIMIAGIAIGAVVIVNKNKQEEFEETIELGAKYLAEMNYEQAIVNYELAIDLNPDESEGYEGLASTYMIMQEYTLAEVALLDGIRMTNAASLTELLNELYLQIQTNDSALLNRGENLEYIETSNVTLNTSVFNTIGSSSYNDYAFSFGSGNTSYSSVTGIAQVTYSGFDGICYYYDTSSDAFIIDEKTELPYANKSPNEVTFTNLSSIFNSIDGIITQDTLEQITGSASIVSYDNSLEFYVISVIYGNCELIIETNEDGNIVSSNAWNQIIPLAISEVETSEDMGSLSGTVINAVTGQGVYATIIVHEGHNEKGAVLDEIDTNSKGEYLFEYVDGEYTFEIESDGFITEFFEVEIKNKNDEKNENFTISPELEDGEIRIVLEWGATPTDLDTYVSGITSTGKSFNVFFGNKTYSENGEEIVNLDVDDTNGYGPETLTISDTGSEFKYWVEDFTSSGTMSESGATVKVYLPNQSSPEIYTVPSGVNNVWEVFTYEDGKVSASN